jgi:hypothetical protein
VDSRRHTATLTARPVRQEMTLPSTLSPVITGTRHKYQSPAPFVAIPNSV